MLKSFVKPEDYQKLISLLLMIKNDLLKDEFLQVIFHGCGNSGKSTLVEICERLAPSSCRYPSWIFRKDYRSARHNFYLSNMNASLVITGELEMNQSKTIIEDIYNLQRCKGENILVSPAGYQVFNPGVFLTCMSARPAPIYGNKVLILELPNTFDPEKISREKVVKMCLEEFDIIQSLQTIGIKPYSFRKATLEDINLDGGQLDNFFEFSKNKKEYDDPFQEQIVMTDGQDNWYRCVPDLEQIIFKPQLSGCRYGLEYVAGYNINELWVDSNGKRAGYVSEYEYISMPEKYENITKDFDVKKGDPEFETSVEYFKTLVKIMSGTE